MNRQMLIPLILGAAVLALFVLAQPDRMVQAEEGETPTFISQKGCKKCHFKQHKSWKKTVHAKAFEILKPGERAEEKQKAGLEADKDYTTDATCVKCHTTGYGKEGGYPEVTGAEFNEDQAKLAKNNAGVGCEACHGPGSVYSPFKKDNEQYKRAEVAARGMNVPVAAEHCEVCHTAEGNPTAGDDYTFDFEKAKENAEAIHEHTELKHEH